MRVELLQNVFKRVKQTAKVRGDGGLGAQGWGRRILGLFRAG